jgi:hypothetical protein
MTPEDYIREIVLPTVLEFMEKPRSRRHAYLTCMALFHVKDHLHEAGEVSIEDKMRAATGKAFDVVRAVCNGTKHVATDASHLIQFRAGDDFDRPPARSSEMEAGISRLGDPVGGREIGHDPSKRADIYQACRTTLTAFCTVFANQLGNCSLSGV